MKNRRLHLLSIRSLKNKHAFVRYFLLCLFIISFQLSYSQNIVYVKASATGSNNGTSWEDAYTSLPTALNNTVSGQLWVASGTYKPGGQRNSKFHLRNNVALYGGFSGTESSLDERDFRNNVTILSGDLGALGRCFNVLLSNALDQTSILDGFTIIRGNAEGGGEDGTGGAILFKGGSNSVVRNCIFKDNNADNGGAVYIHGSSPLFENCIFYNNTCAVFGAAVQNYDGASPVFKNCLFHNNISDNAGGAIMNYISCNPEFYNCTFGDNSAGQGGCTYNTTSSSPVFHNCIIWGNEAEYSGNQIYIGDTNSEPEFYYCDVEGGKQAFAGNGSGDEYGFDYENNNNININPQYADSESNDYQLKPNSPCINAGDPATSGLPDTDLNGDPRLSGDYIDLGPYEFINELPTDITLDSESVEENAPLGTNVGTFTTVDGNSGDIHVYTLISGDGTNDKDNGKFSTEGSDLITNATLDYEKQTEYSIFVQSEDYNGQLFSKAFTIHAINLNDNPPQLSNGEITIDENLTTGTTVYTLDATDNDGSDIITFSIIDGNAGNAFNIEENQIKVKTEDAIDYEKYQNFELTIRASDGANHTDVTVIIHITNLNDNQPELSNEHVIIDENFPTGETVFVLDATDADGTLLHSLSYNIVSGNTNNAFVLNDNVINVNNSAAINYEEVHYFSLTIEVSDGEYSDNALITVLLNNLNDNAPFFGNQEVTINENPGSGSFIFDLEATDPDGTLNELTYSISGGNTDNAFDLIDNRVRVANKPAVNYELRTNFNLTIDVLDGENSASGQLTVNLIDLQEPPYINKEIGIQKAVKEELYEFTFDDDVFIEEDAGDEITFSATLEDDSDLPSWLSFNGSTRTFSGTPTVNDLDTVYIKILAVDNAENTASLTFRLEINNSNDPPVLNNPIPDQTATEDELFTYTIPENTFTDIDAGDIITYSAALENGNNLPYWLSFDNPSRTFSGTPTNYDVTNLIIVVTANDKANETATDTFQLVIQDINDAPRIDNSLQNQTATEDVAFLFTFPENTFIDIDEGDELSYSATLADGSVLPDWLSFDAENRRFSGTPENKDVGITAIKITATDTHGAYVSDEFDITVLNINDAPQINISISDQKTEVNEFFEFTIPADAFIDVDAGDVLSYSASLMDGSSLPAWLSFDPSSRKFSGTPSTVQEVQIKLTVTDSHSAKVIETFTIKVQDNSAPLIVNPIPDQEATVNVAFIFEIPENSFDDYDEDDQLHYHAALNDDSDLPSWLSFTDNPPTLSGIPTETGMLIIKITAYDNDSAYISDLFVLTVNPNTGMSDKNAQQKVSVYPNPANQSMHIRWQRSEKTSENYQIILTDMAGRQHLILSHPAKEKIQVPVSSLPEGIYTLTVKDEEKVVTKKIVIVH